MTLSAPELLNDQHYLHNFDSGVDNLDDWLRRRARSNQKNGSSRTYVVTSGADVVGYYCLASGALATSDAPGNIRRNMPNPIPMTILGRLAVDQNWQGKGIGVALLQDAVLRAQQAAHIVGIRGILVHAISDVAREFYEHYGFTGTPNHPMTLVMPIKIKARISL